VVLRSRRQKFDPERFNQPLPHPYAYLPFGFGARSCPGERVALAEIRVFLAVLFSVRSRMPVSVWLRWSNRAR
jgi:cytochrome P450